MEKRHVPASFAQGAYIRRELTRDLYRASAQTREEAFRNSGNAAIMQVSPIQKDGEGLSVEEARALIMAGHGRAYGALVRAFFRMRGTLKKIPVIGALLVRRKNRLLNSVRLKPLDFTETLYLDGPSFMRTAFPMIYDRPLTEENELRDWLRMRENGASNRAILCQMLRRSDMPKPRITPSPRKLWLAFAAYRFRRVFAKMPVVCVLLRPWLIGNQIAALLEEQRDGVNRLYGAIAALDEKANVGEVNNALRDSRMMAIVQAQIGSIASELKVQRGEAIVDKLALESSLDKLATRVQAVTEEHERLVSLNVEETLAAIKKELDITAILAATTDLSGRLDQLADQSRLDISPVLSIATILSEKLDALAISHKRLDTASILSIATVLSEKLDALTIQSERLNTDTLAVIGTEISQKIDALYTFIPTVANRSKTVVPGLPGGVTVVQTQDFLMGIPSEEWRLAMHLSLNGHFEPGSEAVFASLIKPDMTVVDIGANLGIYTLIAARAGCDVYAFEPTPSIFRLLDENIHMNGMRESGRIRLFNKAVMDTAGTVSFSICEGVSGQNNNVFADGEVQKVISVPAISLDDALADVERIDVIKIDVEGAEPYVFQGMRSILERNPTLKILMEFAPSHLRKGGTDPAAFSQSILDMGFRVRMIDEATKEMRNASFGELMAVESTNLLLERMEA